MYKVNIKSSGGESSVVFNERRDALSYIRSLEEVKARRDKHYRNHGYTNCIFSMEHVPHAREKGEGE